ncbi:DEAD/DEAH box helicase [Jannaschia seohaensis]|uniref:Helicase conserved C-terminal domain-containing protein n=1 Tax=Jannaschia seohaensis TaxID=475081 RepID=A0A2Y9ART7_9RHOB|nr:DEAD/DEAH box helicase [Jannaschia seohaensis]PWJ19366.1 helicase-like protein [Jannaschia seohaensis]SSA46028.1 Helicase conserved C-terminal domain-containing protein [Jannaschia seohaensis]
MIQLSYDQDGVTLEFRSRQSLLDRLLSRGMDPDFDHDKRLSFALADLRATAEKTGDQVEIGSDRIRLSHRTLSALSSETADALGLPPLVDLTLRTDVMGQIGSPDFHLTHDWVRAGRKQIAHRTGAILETSGDGADGLRRLPGWMLDALEVADQFRAGSDLDEHWEALARFRRALEPGVRMDQADAEARLGMTDFLFGLEVTLTDRFSISPRGEDQFAIIPFLGETVEAAERDGEPISEAEAELQEGRLRAFQDKAFARGARPAYKLGAQSYLVVDPTAAPVLKVMADMQRADPVARAAFVRNPRQRITEAVTDHLRSRGKLDGLSPAQEQELIEQAAEPAFVETREYSERVIGLTVYEKPALEITGSGTTWLPEAFTEAAAEKIEALPPDQVERLIHQVDAAIAAGEPTVNVNGAEIPATPTSRTALEQRLEAIRIREEPEDKSVIEEEVDPRIGPIILDTSDNLEDLNWAAKIRPRAQLAPDTLPDVVKSTLKGHQTESFLWKQKAWAAGLPGILNADEQGLGKTLQAIAFLAWLKENMSRMEAGRAGPVLVVAPTSLLINWEEEVDKHLRAPGLGNVVRLYGSILGGKKRPGQQGIETDSGNALLDLRDLEEAIDERRGHRYWVLTTYTTLTNYQHSLAKIPFSTAVFDEIQSVKNPVSLRAKAALAVNADFRIGLTGTPIENSTVDLWAIMEQLIPGRLGSLKAFRERFGEPAEGNMRELYSQMFESQSGLPPVALRRLKEDVARDLPEKSRRLHPRLMPEPQASAYEEARGKLASGTRGSALKMLHHIRSVSVHPNASSPTEDETYISMSARLMAAMDILRGVRDRGERALVFIEHVKMQHRFIELTKREFVLPRVDLINGNTPIPRRQEIVNRFQRHLDRDEGFDLLVLGPKAAGTGLTLTAATHVIHLSRWWNPAVEEQCNDRVHRIGQSKPVTVHVPMAIHPGYQHNSFDCLLHSLMARKRRLATSALWPMGDTEEDASRLQQMLSEGGSARAEHPVSAAMSNMFKRDDTPMGAKNADGSISYQ